jgi:hypothetical protein
MTLNVGKAGTQFIVIRIKIYKVLCCTDAGTDVGIGKFLKY